MVSEKPNICTLIPPPGNAPEEVEVVGEVKLDRVGIRGTWCNRNRDSTVGSESYSPYKTTTRLAAVMEHAQDVIRGEEPN